MSPTEPVETLSHPRLRLRRVQLSDVDEVVRSVQASMDALRPWSPWAAEDYGHAHASNWIAQSWLGWCESRQYDLLMTHPTDGRMLGVVGLNGIDTNERTANLGYWVRADASNQGYATIAASLTARFGFEALKLRRIRLFHAADNHASRRVAEKVGFVLEGRRREHMTVHGVLHDTLSYSLIRADEIRSA